MDGQNNEMALKLKKELESKLDSHGPARMNGKNDGKVDCKSSRQGCAVAETPRAYPEQEPTNHQSKPIQNHHFSGETMGFRLSPATTLWDQPLGSDAGRQRSAFGSSDGVDQLPEGWERVQPETSRW
eukprot:Skav208231  [mRNA]  locus=scaffold2601:87575:90659:+ [translate_table: standard]